MWFVCLYVLHDTGKVYVYVCRDYVCDLVCPDVLRTHNSIRKGVHISCKYGIYYILIRVQIHVRRVYDVINNNNNTCVVIMYSPYITQVF